MRKNKTCLKMYVGTEFKAPLIGLWADIQR